MSCITDEELDGIEVNCESVPTGGIKNVYIAAACDVALGIGIGEYTVGSDLAKGAVLSLAFRDEDEAIPTGVGKVYKLEFNTRDGATSVTEAKTVEDSGIATVLQTLNFQMPRNDVKKRNLANKLVNPFARFLLFIEMNNTYVDTDGTKKNAFIVLGARDGVRAISTGNGSGTGKTDFNGYNLVFEAEENEMSYYIMHPALQAACSTKQVPVSGDPHFDWGEAETVHGTNVVEILRKDCIPAVPAP